MPPRRLSQPRPRPATSPFRDEPPPVFPTFVVGGRVSHDRHGLGTVVRINGDRMDVRVGDTVFDLDAHSDKIHPL